MTSAEKKAILESVINHLYNIDTLVQETLGPGDECYDIHSQIDIVIDLVGETIDNL